MTQSPSSGALRERRPSRAVRLGAVAVGNGAPVSVQSMAKTDTRDVAATVAQIRELELLGCDIMRLAVPDEAAARAIKPIKEAVRIPIVADIHFDHRLAIIAVEAGVDGLRINPGNIGSARNVREVVRAAAPRRVPIRIGVNSGSLENPCSPGTGAPPPKPLSKARWPTRGCWKTPGTGI